ncbi:MAG: glycosyltransferase family 2 protein [Oscillospiraceae bacterium]|nr:glycosyltransferase family 2 protein [Oscillospiraceae bacterium]
MLSVIIPAYNEELSVERAYFTISKILKEAQIENEIIFIDDGSTDTTYEKIKKLADKEKNICGLHFSRNFGKEAAISAGLASASGDSVVVIDCDLQHPPEKIVEMYHLWQEGYEIVEGIKKARGKESKMHGFASRRFYSIISSVVGFDMSNASDFKLLDRKVVDILNRIPERKGFFRAISFWVGFNKTTVEFEVNERLEGESKWSAIGLFKYAVSNISAYSTAPMQIVTVLGVMMLIITAVFSVWALIDKIRGIALEGMTTVIIILIFIGSIMMISLGIIGYYVARIYDEIKGRPKYIISSSCRSKED